MTDMKTQLEIFDAIETRRDARRGFLKYAGGSALAVGGASLLAACGSGSDNGTSIVTPTPTATAAVTDVDVLNFALNLEYLEAQFYAYAAFGVGLNASLQTGVGTQGAVITGSGSGAARAVAFTDPVVQQYAREIAIDEIAHVAFLRSALGSSAVAQPSLNISGSASVTLASGATAVGAFTQAARAAGVVDANTVFDPYLNDNNFLLGAFIFEDVGVTAYKGASPLISNKTYLEAAAGILAAEAYHAGLVRTVLYAKGLTTASLITTVGQISDARDSLDGTVTNTSTGVIADDDQGIANMNVTLPTSATATGTYSGSNIVPTDSNSIVYSRSTGQVLNIVYLSKAATTMGGFFPAGVNGSLRTSAANA